MWFPCVRESGLKSGRGADLRSKPAKGLNAGTQSQIKEPSHATQKERKNTVRSAHIRPAAKPVHPAWPTEVTELVAVHRREPTIPSFGATPPKTVRQSARSIEQRGANACPAKRHCGDGVGDEEFKAAIVIVPAISARVETHGAIVAESERRVALVAGVVSTDRAVPEQAVAPAAPGWGVPVPHAAPSCNWDQKR